MKIALVVVVVYDPNVFHRLSNIAIAIGTCFYSIFEIFCFYYFHSCLSLHLYEASYQISLFLSLRELYRDGQNFAKFIVKNMLLFDSLFFGIKVRNWVGSMNESQGLRVKEEVFKVYN